MNIHSRDITDFSAFGANEVSIYALMSYELPRRASSSGEIDLGIETRGSPCSLFTLDQERADALRRLCGMGATNQWNQIRGFDLPFVGVAVNILYEELRYCQQCVVRGWHSILFQHRLVSRCPFHGCLLTFGCKRCGKPIATTLKHVACNPFGCGACGSTLTHLFPRTRLQAYACGPKRAVFDQRRTELAYANYPRSSIVELTLGLWSNLSKIQHARASLSRLPPSASQIAHIPDRAISLHVYWNQIPLSGVRFHPTEKYRWESENRRLASKRFLDDAAGAVIDLYSLVEGCDLAVDPICNALIAQRARGALFSLEISVVSAALLLTVRRLCSTRPYVGWSGWQMTTRYRSGWGVSSNAQKMIFRHIVFAMMARNLIYAAGLGSASEIDWEREFLPHEVLPGWREVEDHDELVFTIRPACSTHTLKRLIKRFADRRVPGFRFKEPVAIDVRQVIREYIDAKLGSDFFSKLLSGRWTTPE